MDIGRTIYFGQLVNTAPNISDYCGTTKNNQRFIEVPEPCDCKVPLVCFNSFQNLGTRRPGLCPLHQVEVTGVQNGNPEI